MLARIKQELRRIPNVDNVVLNRTAQRRRSFVETYLAPLGGVGAELGVFKGHFTEELLRTARPTQLHAVDPWWLLAPTWPWANGRRSTIEGYVRCCRANAAALQSRQLILHVQDDRHFLAVLEDGELDWAYVDSSHAYEHTVEELQLLHKKVKPGGLITGDDWHDDPKHIHGGVGRAVREFVDAGNARLVYADEASMQWAVLLSN